MPDAATAPAPVTPTAAPSLDEGERVLDILLESLPASEAAKLAARITDAPRNALYKLALGRAK